MMAFQLRYMLHQVYRFGPDPLRALDAFGGRGVLFIRSFSDETGEVGSAVSREKVEFAIRRGLLDYGPFVAIGNPKDRLTPIGATRMYVSDASWQSSLVALVDRVDTIVMIAGDTPGLEWELALIKTWRLWSKLIILIDGTRRGEQERIGRVFRCCLT